MWYSGTLYDTNKLVLTEKSKYEGETTTHRAVYTRRRRHTKERTQGGILHIERVTH